MIEDILGEVNYVVVIQSRAGAQVESYVYTEISIALKRQKRHHEGSIFVIPTKIEPVDNYSAFDRENLQFIDLSNASGPEALVDTIKRDWEWRRKYENTSE